MIWKNLESHKKYKFKYMKIVLTGLRGSGKTKLGKILAKKLKGDFIDTDEEIQEREDMQIKDIVESKGWDYFRSVEKEVVKDLEKLKNVVVSTGGGTILDPENFKKLKKNSFVVYLFVPPEICAKRITKNKNRPPLTNKKSVQNEMFSLFKERAPIYIKTSNLVFNRTEDLKMDAGELIKFLKKNL
jgi:shikimate kinase